MNAKIIVPLFFFALQVMLAADPNKEDGLSWVAEETRKVEIKLDVLRDKKLPGFSVKNVSAVDAFSYLFDRLSKEHDLNFGVMIEEQKNPMTIKRRNLNHSKKVTLELDDASADAIFGSLINMTQWHWSYGDRGQLVIHAWQRPQLMEEKE